MKKLTNLRANLIIEAYKNEIKEGDLVGDIGCFNGAVAEKIRQHFNCTIEGLDIENNLEYEMPFHLIRDFKVDVKDKYFDIVLLNDVLHHIAKEEQAKILDEAKRIGKKVLIFECKRDIVVDFTHWLNKQNKVNAFRTKEEWLGFLKAKELKVKKPFWYPVRHYAFAM